MKKISMLVVCTLLLAAGAWGQNGRDRHSTITVSVDGLTCTTQAGTGMFNALSWGFGATLPIASATGSAISTGKASVSDVAVSKRTDSCSPVLFGDVVLGRHIKKVTILQQDGNKDDVFQLTLEDVIISGYQLSGDETHEVPTEQLTLNFGKITIKDMITGTTFGWNVALNKGI
jgi:type VI protein secretion system component Hcp